MWFQRIFLSYLRHQPHTKLIHCSAPPPPPSPRLAEDILLCSSHNTTYNGRGNSFHFPVGWRRRRRRASSGRPSVLPPGRPSTSTLSAFQRPEPGAAAPRKQGKSLITQTQKVKWEPCKHRLSGCLDVHYVSRSFKSHRYTSYLIWHVKSVNRLNLKDNYWITVNISSSLTDKHRLYLVKFTLSYASNKKPPSKSHSMPQMMLRTAPNFSNSTNRVPAYSSSHQTSFFFRNIITNHHKCCFKHKTCAQYLHQHHEWSFCFRDYPPVDLHVSRSWQICDSNSKAFYSPSVSPCTNQSLEFNHSRM